MDRIEEMIQNLELLRMHFGDITKTCMANGIIDSTIKAIEKLATYENAEKHGLPERYEADEKDTPAKKPQTNADRIRSMTDEELAEWITNMCDFERHGEPYKSIYNLDTDNEEEIHDSYGDLLIWLKAESEE
jgi:hypothetical protein